jgi:pimeloyl-ACP methyl ester carboxylesterase
VANQLTRPIEEVRDILLERARSGRNPFFHTRFEEVAPVIERLDSVDHAAWVAAFSALAEPHEARAVEAEQRGHSAVAFEDYRIAYDYMHVARYPAPSSPPKVAAYRRAQELFMKAARYLDPPLERVEIPFTGGPGEGDLIVGYLRVPSGVLRPPVVINWGGIDSFKEERPADHYLSGGLAALALDMPGAGESPLTGSLDAERMWDPVFDWLRTRSDVDGSQVAVVGGSTGGYWATKLAHTRSERLRAVVNHGGPAHFAFEADWIARAERGEYPFELAATLAFSFGLSGPDQWVDFAPSLSLLRTGLLDQPSAPMLCIAGLDDSVFPIQDMYLLLERGRPKAARFFAGGHMGITPETQPTITRWLVEKLS